MSARPPAPPLSLEEREVVERFEAAPDALLVDEVNDITVTFTVDTSGFEAALRKAVEAVNRFAWAAQPYTPLLMKMTRRRVVRERKLQQQIRHRDRRAARRARRARAAA